MCERSCRLGRGGGFGRAKFHLAVMAQNNVLNDIDQWLRNRFIEHLLSDLAFLLHPH